MKQHFAVVKPNRFGGHNYSTLCGRQNKQSDDGGNSTALHSQVTCKFCLKILAQKQAAQDAQDIERLKLDIKYA
jgi:hypothetical protein